MNPEWREFEKLVARIEGYLSPKEAKIISPDFILDKVTGEKREVDASIRYYAGSTPILIILECRKRNSRQDVTWIEQLVTKKNDIGASITIAISSKGFSKAAIKKAAHYGIELRGLENLQNQAEEVVSWLRARTVTVVEKIWNVEDMSIELYNAPDDVQLAKEFHSLSLIDGKIFIRPSDGECINNRILINMWREKNGDVFNGVPQDGSLFKKKIVFTFSKGELTTLTNKGVFDIMQVHLSLILNIDVRQVPISFFSEYQNPDNPIAQVAEWELSPEMNFSITKKADTNEYSLGVMLENERHKKQSKLTTL